MVQVQFNDDELFSPSLSLFYCHCLHNDLCVYNYFRSALVDALMRRCTRDAADDGLGAFTRDDSHCCYTRRPLNDCWTC